MKKFILLPIVSGLTLALTACGGGSSQNESTSSSSQTASTGSTVQAQTISLNAYTYQCGVESPYQADIVFHDESGEPLGSSKTNAQGEFSDEIPIGTVHVSIVGAEKDSDFEDYTKIQSELSIQGRTNLGKFYFTDYTEDCGCQTYQLDKSDLGNIANYYDLKTSFGSYLGDSIRVCPSDQKVYLTAESFRDYDVKAAVIDIPTGSEIIKLKESDFKHQGVDFYPSINQYPEYVSSRAYIPQEHQYQLIRISSELNSKPLHIFPSVSDHNFLVKADSKSSYVDYVEVDFFSYARDRVNDDGSHTDTRLPVITEELAASLVQFANNTELTYDFSNADERFARARWGFSFLVDDAMESRFDWTLHGGISGEIPDLSFGDVFPEPQGNVTIDLLDLDLYGYAGNATDAATYRTLLERMAEGGHITQPEFSNYVSLIMRADLY